jgi:hypothetical protein
MIPVVNDVFEVGTSRDRIGHIDFIERKLCG